MINPPYGPPTNTIAIIRKWRDAGLPDQATSEWLLKIGIKESLFDANRRALAFLGLTDEDGNTTEAARRLAVAPSDEYASVLEEVVRAAYAPIFSIVDPQTATRTQVDDAFRGEKPPSQRSRMVAFFLGLCGEAGLTLREPPQGGRAASALPKRATIIKREGRGSTPLPPAPPRYESQPNGVLFHPAIDSFLREARKLTDQDLWTKETRDFVVQGFTTQLDLFVPVRPKTARSRRESIERDGLEHEPHDTAAD